MIDIDVNGDAQQVASGTTISDLLQGLDLQGKRVAVEYNLEILPRSQHAATVLQASDRVEIVHAIGGG